MSASASQDDFLSAMAIASAQRAAAARAQRPLEELLAQAHDLPRPPRWIASPDGFDLIAEVKWRSPALGALRTASASDLGARVEAYAEAGAAAISVLTEPSRFDGSLEHLRDVATRLSTRPMAPPVMRKDFLVDPYQILEARLGGAGGVLLIVRMLDTAMLARMIDSAREHDLFVLLEIFDEPDIERAITVLDSQRTEVDGQVLIGVNCRDLVSLQVVPDRLERMAGCLPEGLPRVAESGVETPEDAGRLAAIGYDAALVGGALMRAENPHGLASAMLQAARSVRLGV